MSSPGTGLLHKQAHLDGHAVLLAIAVPRLHPYRQPGLCRKICGLRTIEAMVEARVVGPCNHSMLNVKGSACCYQDGLGDVSILARMTVVWLHGRRLAGPNLGS